MRTSQPAHAETPLMGSLPRPCKVAYCPETTTDGPRCSEHTQEHESRRQQRRRKQRGKRRYDKRDWRDRIRPRQLKREPLCRFCKQEGTLTPASEVDHIDGNPYNDSTDNLRSLCKPCHSRRTFTEQVG